MRDYYKEPLKRGEHLPYNVLYDLYINQNKTREDISKVFNVTPSKVGYELICHKITKPKELISEKCTLGHLKDISYISKDTLYDLYVVKRYSRAKTAELMGLTLNEVKLAISRWNFIQPKTIRIPYDDLYSYYIEENHTIEETMQYFNVKRTKLQNDLKFYGIQKPWNKRVECQERVMLEKYGVRNTSMLQETKEKKEQTCLNNYGVKYGMQNEAVREQAAQTCLEKYGNTCYMASDEGRQKIKEIINDKYGVENVSQVAEIREKIKQNSLKNWGTENPMQNEDLKKRYDMAMYEKYGVKRASQLPEIKEKVKQTNLERFGETSYSKTEECKEKIKATVRERYGYDFAGQVPEFQEKQRQTSLKKYGKEHYFGTEEFKENLIKHNQEKYGVDYFTQTKEFIEKCKQTCLAHFGTEFYTQTEESKERFKQTCLKKYGVDNPKKLDKFCRKAVETAKANNSFNTSKFETKINELLTKKFQHVIREYYTDERYPFRCDFYVPERDLFIEIQGHPSHGKHPFDPYNDDDMALLNRWFDKAEEINKVTNKKKNQYLSYAYIWAVRDPLKRQTAKENNLNWLEFFNMQEFMDWYNQQ